MKEQLKTALEVLIHSFVVAGYLVELAKYFAIDLPKNKMAEKALAIEEEAIKERKREAYLRNLHNIAEHISEIVRETYIVIGVQPQPAKSIIYYEAYTNSLTNDVFPYKLIRGRNNQPGDENEVSAYTVQDILKTELVKSGDFDVRVSPLGKYYLVYIKTSDTVSAPIIEMDSTNTGKLIFNNSTQMFDVRYSDGRTYGGIPLGKNSSHIGTVNSLRRKLHLTKAVIHILLNLVIQRYQLVR
jgi:hypothetical protein